MNLVFIIDHLRPDGTQTVLVQLVTGLAARGYTQAVVCLNDSWDHDIIDRLNSVGASVRIIGKSSLASGYGVFSLLHYFRTAKFDVAITFLHVSDVVGRALARWAGVPRIVSSLRARNVNYSSLQRWLVRTTIKIADAIIINTDHARDFAIREEGASPDRIHVVANGVSVETFSNPISQTLLREKLGLAKTGCLLGTVGRLTKQKGIDILLQALSLISSTDFNLIILGTGGDQARLRTLALKLGLESRVYFAGYRRDLPTLLGALDLYVHPARFEGMPNAVLEAMAAACPIVATAVDGNRELIEDGKHGWLVPAEDPVRLANAIQEALGNRYESRRRGAAARQRVVDCYSVDTMVMTWEKLLAGTH